VRRFAIMLAAIVVALVATALPLSAHVSILPSEAQKGAAVTLAFQIPNEGSDAKTTSVAVQFPAEHPIADAAVQPIPGWKVQVTTKKLTTPITTDEGASLAERVDVITWTATGAGIGAGEFQQFLVSVGLPSDTDTLTFPTVQTYSNGDKVSWIEERPVGGAEPDHPIPELKLTGTNQAGTPASAASVNDDNSAKALAVVALIVAVIGLLVGVGGFAARRRAERGRITTPRS
jgi:uncharacterized protein